MCVWVCVYAHTHTLHRCSDVSPGVGMRHLEGPKNPDGLNPGIHVLVYVYKVHMCIYMLRGEMRSWTNCSFSLTYFFFRKRKAKDVNANHWSSQILIPRFERIDPQSRVLTTFYSNKSNHHHQTRPSDCFNSHLAYSNGSSCCSPAHFPSGMHWCQSAVQLLGLRVWDVALLQGFC